MCVGVYGDILFRWVTSGSRVTAVSCVCHGDAAAQHYTTPAKGPLSPSLPEGHFLNHAAVLNQWVRKKGPNLPFRLVPNRCNTAARPRLGQTHWDCTLGHNSLASGGPAPPFTRSPAPLTLLGELRSLFSSVGGAVSPERRETHPCLSSAAHVLWSLLQLCCGASWKGPAIKGHK